jgi:hypothetical protein
MEQRPRRLDRRRQISDEICRRWGGTFFPYTIPLTAPPRGGVDSTADGEGGALPV